ncbi:MAG: hypothetical protein ACYDAD_10055 [Acidimicrobiales bacterium]
MRRARRPPGAAGLGLAALAGALGLGLAVLAGALRLGSAAPALGAAPVAAGRPPAPPVRRDQVVEVADVGAPGGRVALDTSLLLPARADAGHQVAAVVMDGGIGATKEAQEPLARRLADEGYAVLRYSAPASGDLGADSGHLRQLLGWLGRQPEVAQDGPGLGRVALEGVSSGADAALSAAAAEHRADAVVAFGETGAAGGRETLRRIQAPTMFVQDEADAVGSLNRADEGFAAIAGTAKEMVWTERGRDEAVVTARVVAWLDRWERADRSVATGPEFSWFDPGRARMESSPSYPILTRRRVAIAPASSSSSPSSSSVTSSSVIWQSAPLSAALDVVGVPRLSVRRAGPTETAVVVGIEDVAPDGSTTALGPAPVSLPRGTTDPALTGLVHRFARGHRVALRLSAPDGNPPRLPGSSPLLLPARRSGRSIGGPLAVGAGVVAGPLLLLLALRISPRQARAREAQPRTRPVAREELTRSCYPPQTRLVLCSVYQPDIEGRNARHG